MKKLRFLLALWLTIAATGVWAEESPGTVVDNIPAGEQVQMSDGRTVKAMQVPRRASSEDYTYTYKGVKYTYISENNYTKFFNTSAHTPETYGWYKDDDGWFINAEGAYITAASIDEESVPENGEVYILNDLVGYFTSHTHLGCVADQGFTGKSKVKRIYFQDANAQAYNANSEFHFFIGHLAFANAPYLEKVDLMQYTTKGTNHWEAMPAYRVKSIWDNAFEGSPNAMIRVATSVIDDYRNSSVWATHKDRIISYEPSGYEIKEYGARYKCMLAQDGKTYLTNDGNQREEVMKQLRLWNADYWGLNATSLMAPADNGATVYYTTIEGADTEYLKKNNGVLRVYNDVGSYYNYKNIAIRRGAFANCEDLKTVEFWQTNGRSSNSYSDLKVVIENGAFRGCKNLKEIRLYYFAEKGENHWETLGPKDVIPGNNIFGVPTPEELKGMTEEQVAALPPSCAKDFRILVSPARYLEFIKDPNWAMYAQFIEAADYEPTTKKSIVKDGLTYEYMSTSAGMLSTDNVVSQNWSWWSVPVLAAEIALYAYAAYKVGKGVVQAISAGDAASGAAGEAISEVSRETVSEVSRESVTAYANTAIASEATLGAAKEFAGSIPVFARGFTEAFTAEQISAIAGKNLAEIGFSSYAITELAREGFCSAAGVMYSADVLTNLLSTNIARTTLCTYAAKVVAELTATLAPEVVVPEVAAVVSSMGLPAWASQTLVHMADGVLLSSLSASLITARMQGSDYNSNKFRSGLIANNLSYIHAASMTGIGLNMIYTPSKNMVYHQYISKAEPNISKVNIYAGVDDDTRTMTFRKNVFAGNIFLEEVCFYEAKGSTTKESVPMTIAIPDSAFVGCINMKRFDLRLYTGGKPSQALGPENFILCGDNIFAGCDSTKLKIIIAKDRKQDFLDDGMWSKYKRFFAYEETEYPDVKDDFGVKYVYAYEGNSTQKVSMKNGHKVEHLVAWGPDDSWINDHKGQLGLFNDIGIYNNYKLDYVRKEAFRGNQNLKNVSCWDIKGWLWCGDIYYDFNVALQDSCFADCPNLEAFDLLYLCTDGINKAKELHPSQLQLGNGVFANTPKLMLKMTQQQQRWFEADTTWAKYKDKFTPCLVKPVDGAVKNILKGLCYTTAVGSPSEWSDVIDMSRLKEKGFESLNGILSNNDNLKQFPEFKQFEWAGLDFIGGSWFVNDHNLTAIELPSTIKKIGGYAFQNCDLREIEIPAAVTQIDEMAFNGNANMKVIRCLGTTPAALGTAVFEKPEGLKIYVPAGSADAYKEKWSDYKDYIVAASDAQTFPKSVTTTEVGQLAQKLGLETIMSGDFLTGLKGAYWNIDSLTVSGPLNGVDVGVLRFLGGADVNNSDPTYGRLRYLNLYNARLKKDKDHPYQCHGVNDFIGKDDVVDEYMFYYCNKLEKVILPKEATYIGEHVFDNAVNLKHLAIGDKVTGYDDRVTYQVPGIDEMVFMTTEKAVSDASGGLEGSGQYWFWTYDSWETPINAVYCRNKLVPVYANEPTLTKCASSITAAFKDDRALDAFAAKGYFFPSEYMQLTNIDGILTDSGVETFDELVGFTKMTELGSALADCDNLKRVYLPASLKKMNYQGFKGCKSLMDVYVYCDTIPQLEDGTFDDLPMFYRINVPMKLVKRYREAWPRYANHIVGNNFAAPGSDMLVVTTTEKNTLAKELGLKVKSSRIETGTGNKLIDELEGAYSHIRKLKVVGPISGQDFSVLRYLAGYCGWTDSRNCLGQLEYLDLYDATVEPSDWYAAPDRLVLTSHSSIVKEANVLPYYAFLRAYSLKKLILPKTLKTIHSRSLLECESLETVVIGDSTNYINWDAFDDCVSLTRMYILADKKPEMTQDNWLWRNLCNNYNPTFDAFYVRPSLYKDYVADDAYTGSSWQRTNNISTGVFKDDESFAAFAAHAAATKEELQGVDNVDGWFKNRPNIKDLSLLSNTSVTELKAADMKPLTKLERIGMPMTLEQIEDNSFSDAKNLRWADFMMCGNADLMTDLQNGGLRKKGFTEKTLCFMPGEYGVTDEVNVAAPEAPGAVQLRAKTIRIYDGLDYVMPYSVDAETIENTRTLPRSDKPYSVCLPYSLSIPEGAVVYRLDDCNSNELVFKAVDSNFMMEGQPYLVRATNDVSLDTRNQMLNADNQMWPGQQDVTGFTMRGTINSIPNAEASDLGAYVLQSDGKWHAVMADTDEHRSVSIPAYRCYLLKNRGAWARTISMTLDDNSTGIDRIRTIDNDGTERLYDLNGRLIDGNAKGVVIKNGKKVIN